MDASIPLSQLQPGLCRGLVRLTPCAHVQPRPLLSPQPQLSRREAEPGCGVYAGELSSVAPSVAVSFQEMVFQQGATAESR